ncbi:alkyl sulfatase dimerization domain-containing protein [Streptomyces sp. NPDC016845]|uniref:alkyl sulfatase dimerization domain-containing protein n=1 Tax=Streptomyces sp. NPDC016845 TaxID=3364972 RepID=UPI0037AE288C
MADHHADDEAAGYLSYIDRVWREQDTLAAHLSGRWTRDRLLPLTERVGFFPAFANVAVFDTGDGLVMVDSGDRRTAASLHRAVTAYSSAPVSTVVFTHGHVDHVFGVTPFDRAADASERPRPHVVAHEAIAARFDRYRHTSGYNAWINRRQFGVPELTWPTTYRYPDRTYRDELTLRHGDLTFELRHARGETDDHTYVWVPELKTLCTGDLFIWNAPNAGNPQKVQRYPQEWARALRRMRELDAELLLPGHGVPIVGRDRIRRALDETARLLETLCEQTRELMNAGHNLDSVLQRVEVPAELLSRPYLRPAYDEPEFVVRNLWRLWGGWYDQNPSHLKPAPDAAVAAEFARLAGGAGRLAERAAELAGQGELRLASHLAEAAALAAPEDRRIAGVRADVYRDRAARETSTMARGVFSWAAAESAAVANGTDTAAELEHTPMGAARRATGIAVGVVESAERESDAPRA